VGGLSVGLFLINISYMGLCVSVNVSFICSPSFCQIIHIKSLQCIEFMSFLVCV
jgi:hypothetical protein